jgi:hypothetical protein
LRRITAGRSSLPWTMMMNTDWNRTSVSPEYSETVPDVCDLLSQI